MNELVNSVAESGRWRRGNGLVGKGKCRNDVTVREPEEEGHGKVFSN